MSKENQELDGGALPGNLIDLVFENKVYPCYSIKLFLDNDEIQIHRDRKCLKKFKASSFPANMDFTKPETVFSLISLVKQGGCAALLQRYPSIQDIGKQ